MDRLVATGVAPAKIERFLDADLDGTGSVRDKLAAAMTNELLAIFGHPSRQTAADVRHIRERGTWKLRDQRPEGLL